MKITDVLENYGSCWGHERGHGHFSINTAYWTILFHVTSISSCCKERWATLTSLFNSTQLGPGELQQLGEESLEDTIAKGGNFALQKV